MFKRVDVRAEIVAREAGGGFDLEDIFGGESFPIAQPSEDRALGFTDQAREGRLRSDNADGLREWRFDSVFKSHEANLMALYYVCQ
jgi:hypothetical protein